MHVLPVFLLEEIGEGRENEKEQDHDDSIDCRWPLPGSPM